MRNFYSPTASMMPHRHSSPVSVIELIRAELTAESGPALNLYRLGIGQKGHVETRRPPATKFLRFNATLSRFQHTRRNFGSRIRRQLLSRVIHTPRAILAGRHAASSQPTADANRISLSRDSPFLHLVMLKRSGSLSLDGSWCGSSHLPALCGKALQWCIRVAKRMHLLD
jgi:hypothetical protein